MGGGGGRSETKRIDEGSEVEVDVGGLLGQKKVIDDETEPGLILRENA